MIVKHFQEVKAEKPPVLQFKGKPVKAKGTVIRWLVSEKTVGEDYPYNFALRHFTMKPGGVIPMHEHPYEEAVFLLKGRLNISTGTMKASLKRGQYAYLAPNEPHEVSNPGPGEAVFLCCIGYRYAAGGKA